MIDRRSLAALPLLAAAPCLARGGDASERFGSAFARALAGKASGAALAARGGRVIWRGAAGLDAAVPAPPVHAVFDTLSIGKTFTAITVLRLAEGRAIDLNKPVKAYLPELGAAIGDIKVRHALNNDTGLPTYLAGGDLDPRSAAQALAEIAPMVPERKGGTGYHYSNVSFQLLGLMVERVTRRPFTEVVRDLVLRPAGMASTGFFGADSFGGAPLATGFVDGKPVGRTREWPETWSLLGAAGLGSTVDDLYRLNRRFFAGAGLGPEARARFLLAGAPTYGRGPYLSPDTIDISYGAGLFHWIDRAGRHVAFHGGDGDFGFNAVMFWRAEDDLFVTVLMNSSRTAPPLDRGEMMSGLLSAIEL